MDDEREEQITDLSMQRSRAGREDRADFLEDARTGRADEVELLRERRAAELAYTQGRREADVDSHLRNHDQMLRSHAERLKVINGSIAGTGLALRTLTEKIDTKNAVDIALRDAIKEANAKSLDARSFKMWMSGTMVMLLGVVVALLAGAHVL